MIFILILCLGSPDFREREQAHSFLEKSVSNPLIYKSLELGERSLDPEIRARCRLILDRYHVKLAKAMVKPRISMDAGRVRLDCSLPMLHRMVVPGHDFYWSAAWREAEFVIPSDHTIRRIDIWTVSRLATWMWVRDCVEGRVDPMINFLWDWETEYRLSWERFYGEVLP